MSTLLGLVTLIVWLVLWLRHGDFWKTDISPLPAMPSDWPSVVAVIPARNEEEGIGRAVGSLLTQDYKGAIRVVVVDDESTDDTATVAERTASAAKALDRLTIIDGTPTPAGWTGKMWAVSQGLAKAAEIDPSARYVLLTDGDITHGPRNVAHLVARAEGGALDLTSLMVRLRCEDFAERFLIPAFVFFFEMLYPFAWVNDVSKKTAGAAGGCMLVRRTALDKIGGIAAIKGALIDDCALAIALKKNGPIWLGLTNDAHSLRVYGDIGEVWNMVARTAYTQLNYSPLLLAGTVLGLIVTFLSPPLLFLFGHGTASFLGLVAWIIQIGCYIPILRFYGLRLWWAPLLPAVAAIYLGATLDSALRHMRGKGGAWKGRFQAS
ncbi:MAG TPA: glycosyltransferase, partial [Alphaproteobacteria bacterium]|nr:glycosyltransferase [Alphaproteobacteria bacterium]